ncbi:hypothetical protein PoB_002087000 [Plakobranchus ocellatus]|uniref:Uncharacterized protein n=1 Tax=Plakobranchus ocellatus TaxID=259542 RepID=A0AAV3ZGT3_9GAST|nr:hypothetical protein PoB_002087000 [Plakobranchus ocellatus]
MFLSAKKYEQYGARFVPKHYSMNSTFSQDLEPGNAVIDEFEDTLYVTLQVKFQLAVLNYKQPFCSLGVWCPLATLQNIPEAEFEADKNTQCHSKENAEAEKATEALIYIEDYLYSS